ncbi:MAG: protein-methionine-sulfoxide reductase catalytic subunit MsrP, partial [Pseudomonadota bacterium]
MLIQNAANIASSEITPESAYLDRRQLLMTGVGAIATGTGLILPFAGGKAAAAALPARKSKYSTDEPPSRYRDITTYNNFIEFGARKTDPSYFAGALKTRPWRVDIDGLVEQPQTIDIDDLLKRFELEERIYRLRCVEAWSMVVPWVGFPLSSLLKQVVPQGSAKYVRFETVYRPSEMRGQRKSRPIIPWP